MDNKTTFHRFGHNYVINLSRYCVCFLFAAKAAKKGSKGVNVKPIGEVPELNMTVCRGLNIYNSGEDPKIQDESQYPEWLWTLLDPADTLTPEDKRYWRRIRKARIRSTNQLLKQRH